MRHVLLVFLFILSPTLSLAAEPQQHPIGTEYVLADNPEVNAWQFDHTFEFVCVTRFASWLYPDEPYLYEVHVRIVGEDNPMINLVDLRTAPDGGIVYQETWMSFDTFEENWERTAPTCPQH